MNWPDWIWRPIESTWSFDTSEGVEFDASALAFGKGSFFIYDDTDSDAIRHEILYVGLGATTSKGPIPLSAGGSFSTPDMWSASAGKIGMKPSLSSLKLDDFGGSGLIASFGLSLGETKSGDGRGMTMGRSGTIVLFGFPPFTVATLRIKSEQYMLPGAGFTMMPCYFTIDP
jgi:hypothetical protein